jgi:peptidoglycan/LPS O-acetylase OafA/YrhL
MRRYEELDSLRGLAALSVVFSHFMITFNVNGNDTYHTGFSGNWYKYSPIHIFWAGHEAVILFFLLSGFVLTLPFLNKNPFSYQGYLIKRVLRIYPASAISILAVICLISILDNNSRSIDSLWISNYWVNDISIPKIISQLSLIGNEEVTLNPVLWSLIHEMRISIVFPLIAYLVIKLDWKKVIVLCLGFSVIGYLMTTFLEAQRLNLSESLRYSSMFMVGSLLAKYRNNIISAVSKLKSINMVLLFLVGAILYTFSWIFYGITLAQNPFINDWLITLGGSIFIIVSLSSTKVSAVLKTKIPSFFGKISYSLYLYHLIILIFLMKYNSGLSVTTTLILTFVLSIFTATISYRFIEKPFIKLGKNLDKRLRKTVSLESDLKKSS